MPESEQQPDRLTAATEAAFAELERQTEAGLGSWLKDLDAEESATARTVIQIDGDYDLRAVIAAALATFPAPAPVPTTNEGDTP